MTAPKLLETNWQLPEIKATVPVLETKSTTGIFRNIWTGIKNLFTNPKPAVTTDGKTVILQDKEGNPIVAKSTNWNWEAILSGVGALVGIFTGANTQNSTGENGVSAQVQNDQNVRSGKSAIILVIVGLILLIGSLFIIKKIKK